jgi:hypothetical protein
MNSKSTFQQKAQVLLSDKNQKTNNLKKEQARTSWLIKILSLLISTDGQ